MSVFAGLLSALLVFAAAALAVWALTRQVAARLELHPDLVREVEAETPPGLLRAWKLAVRIAARELPQSRLDGLRQRIAVDLARTAGPPHVTPETFLAQALLEGLGLAVTLAVLLLALTGRPFLILSLGIGLLHALGIRPQRLRALALQRVNRVQRRLPYSIDLAVLVLRAGGTLREALSLIAERGDDPLAEELAVALQEIRSGTAQSKALNNLADRIRLEDLSTLILAINRGEEVGAPLAQTLETQSEIFRFRRMQRAERLAVEAPVKMMFPNMIIMIAVLLVVLGPIFVKLVQDGPF